MKGKVQQQVPAHAETINNPRKQRKTTWLRLDSNPEPPLTWRLHGLHVSGGSGFESRRSQVVFLCFLGLFIVACAGTCCCIFPFIFTNCPYFSFLEKNMF